MLELVLSVAHLNEMLSVHGMHYMPGTSVNIRLGLIVHLLHHVQLGRVQYVVNVDAVRSEDSFARLGRMRLAIYLPVVQIHLVGVVCLQIELTVAYQTLETRLVVNIAFDRTDALQRVDLCF